MKYKYGLIKYEGGNLGDEIQSLAAKRFLPRVDLYVDRDNLKNIKSNQKIKLIMNGWFMHRPLNWPPSPDIEPLFISFHISPSCARELTSNESIQYFRKHEPIGCRDYYTRDLLRKKGIESYFSGCLTLTLQSNTTRKSNEILLVDLDKEALKNIPKKRLNSCVILDHYGYNPLIKKMYNLARKNNFLYSFYKLALQLREKFKVKLVLHQSSPKKFQRAEALLKRYSMAKLVITSRLHCALPCLAFNTPVIFVSKNLNDPRLKGYLEYLRCYSVEEFKERVKELDWECPPQNPKSIEKIRKKLVETCKKFINDD